MLSLECTVFYIQKAPQFGLISTSMATGYRMRWRRHAAYSRGLDTPPERQGRRLNRRLAVQWEETQTDKENQEK